MLSDMWNLETLLSLNDKEMRVMAMSKDSTIRSVPRDAKAYYPESHAKPMTEVHLNLTIDFVQMLGHYFQDRQTPMSQGIY